MGTHNGGAEVTDHARNLDRKLDRARTPRAGGDDDPKDPSKEPEPAQGDDVELEDKPISATPRRYKVIFHNDDYTTMEFVIEVLKRFFHKTDTEAVHIMLTVHKSGAAVAGVFTRDVAETKSTQVMDYARENGMPLLLTTEPE
jgi:ATP-dependent Clp protease adaptor protein ClpS